MFECFEFEFPVCINVDSMERWRKQQKMLEEIRRLRDIAFAITGDKGATCVALPEDFFCAHSNVISKCLDVSKYKLHLLKLSLCEVINENNCTGV